MGSDSLGYKETESRSDLRMGPVYCSAEVYAANCLRVPHSINKYLLSSYSVSGPGEQDRHSPRLPKVTSCQIAIDRLRKLTSKRTE